ncbi:MAG TPA: alpha/beta fold hydrolase [Coriobacteriia bacterium]
MTNDVQHTDHAGQELPLGDVTLYYEVHGIASGIPLFVVNGGPGLDHSYLEVAAIWRELETRRQVIFYDQRGTGRSSRLAAGQSCGLADQLTDLHALRQHLGFEQVDLLGHSFGGLLAMAYSARYPQHVHKLILVGSVAPKLDDTVFLFEQVSPETTVRRNALAFRADLGDEEAILADLREHFSMCFYSPQKRDAFLSVADSFTYRDEVRKMLWTDAAQFDLGPELAKFQLPTLVITGRHDLNVAPVVAFKIHQAIAGSRFAVFEESGHLPFFEEPEMFLNAVDSFLV